MATKAAMAKRLDVAETYLGRFIPDATSYVQDSRLSRDPEYLGLLDSFVQLTGKTPRRFCQEAIQSGADVSDEVADLIHELLKREALANAQ